MELEPIRIDRETFLADHFMLPPLPAVVNRLLEAIQSGRATAGEVASLLSADPSLVAQLLKLVNSAYYGLPRRIGEVKHAVAYLGLAEIERVALAAAVMRFASPEESDEFHQFWYHSFYTALISKLLSRERIKDLEGNDLYSAALLHDIGKLVYMKFYPEHYRALVRHCQIEGVLLVDAERRYEMPSHTMLGEILCERWILPAHFKRACGRHELEQIEHLDPTERHYPELQLICLANLLGNLVTSTLSTELKKTFRRATMSMLQCGEQDFLMLMGQVYELRSEVEHFLHDL